MKMSVPVLFFMLLSCWCGRGSSLPTNGLKIRINVAFTLLNPSDRQKEIMQQELTTLVEDYFSSSLPSIFIRIEDLLFSGKSNINTSFGVVTTWNTETVPSTIAFQFMRFLTLNSFYLGEYRVDPWSVIVAGQLLSPPPDTTQHPETAGGAPSNSMGRETRIFTLGIFLRSSDGPRLLQGSWELGTLTSSTVPQIIDQIATKYGRYFLRYRNVRILSDKSSLEVDMVFSKDFTEPSSAVASLAINFVFRDPRPETKLLNITIVKVTETSVEEIPVSFKITNMDYKEELRERSSRTYRELSRQIATELSSVYTNMRNTGFVWIEQFVFSKGSVNVQAVLLVNKKYMNSPEKMSENFRDLFKQGQLGSWNIDPDSIKAYVTEGEEDDAELYYIIGPVLGGIFVIVLSIGLIARCLYWSRKDKKDQEEAKQKRSQKRKQKRRRRQRKYFVDMFRKVMEWQRTGTISVQTGPGLGTGETVQTVAVPPQTPTETEPEIIVSSNRAINLTSLTPDPLAIITSNRSINDTFGIPEPVGLKVSSNKAINKNSRPADQGPVVLSNRAINKKKKSRKIDQGPVVSSNTSINKNDEHLQGVRRPSHTPKNRDVRVKRVGKRR